MTTYINSLTSEQLIKFIATDRLGLPYLYARTLFGMTIEARNSRLSILQGY